MEQVLLESYHENNLKYLRNRVFNNYSGHRPAEPSSLAAVATWHTLSRLQLELILTVRKMCPYARVLHPWEYDYYASKIQRWFRRNKRSYTHSDDTQNGRIMKRQNAMKHSNMNSLFHKSQPIVMLLSDGCIEDMKSLISENVLPNISNIVGFDRFRKPLKSSATLSKIDEINPSIHDKLVEQGIMWSQHVNEPWNMLVLSGLYILVSVGLGLPIIGLFCDAILKVIRVSSTSYAISSTSTSILAFTPRFPSIIRDQSAAYTLIGLVIQCLDAIFFIYITKNMTRISRWLNGRPYFARHGKRTVVIVDNPCIHQLTENYVSKLYSQAYSVTSIDVHGASGFDHFVHRFNLVLII